MTKRFRSMVGLMVAVVSLILSGCGELNKPPMPVKVTYRSSAVGEGYVAQFQNQTSKYLAVRVVFKNRTLNQTKEGSIDLPPNGSTEIGWMEGWKFVSGESIDLYHEDYSSASYRIP
ncbi:MAG TPA: hypothetical protein DCZ94_20100 [Lentisphaeria bacterium]|nr:MAG: hypothetical protein A2X48_14745 [Lentisphaerae bacterium GWF2_49_21]HBC89249.1 hypothetical protein [Lentisphaeria bacterium]